MNRLTQVQAVEETDQVQDLLLEVDAEFVGLEEVFSLLNDEIDEGQWLFIHFCLFEGPLALLQDYRVDLNLFFSVFDTVRSVIPIMRNFRYDYLLVARCFLA